MSYVQKIKERAEKLSKLAKEKAEELFAENSIQEHRMSICKSCPHFIELTSQCKKCGCYLPAKTKLSGTSCPIGKWVKIIE